MNLPLKLSKSVLLSILTSVSEKHFHRTKTSPSKLIEEFFKSQRFFIRRITFMGENEKRSHINPCNHFHFIE